MEWLESLVLGVVQGITEFLPVSSDGHLVLTQNFFAWLTGHARPGKENLFFDVILHLGTTCAILFYHRRSIAQGWRGLAGSDRMYRPGFAVPRSSGWACSRPWRPSPLVPFALFFKKRAREATFEGTTWAGYGFLVTAAVLADHWLAEPARWGQGAG